MARRKRYQHRDNDLERALEGFAALFVLGLVGYVIVNPEESLAYGLAFIAFILAFILAGRWWKKRHFENILTKLRDSGDDEYVRNFINRFGFEGAKGSGWSFRNRKFDRDRINDFKKILNEKGIARREKDAFGVLRFFIQEKEEGLTRESIRKEPQRFDRLSGTDFEKLLYRLFEAMGYKVEWIGKSGDQGGDLIANKDGERVLIQAKCYRNWSVGNEAVQQVVAAMKFYDCSKSIVITTSEKFTNEARALAHANSTDLISKNQLSEMLIAHLKEDWG